MSRIRQSLAVALFAAVTSVMLVPQALAQNTSFSDTIDALTALVPDDAVGVAVVDLAGIDDADADFDDLLADPMVAEMFGAIEALDTSAIDYDKLTSAMVVYTSDPTPFVLATAKNDPLEQSAKDAVWIDDAGVLAVGSTEAIDAAIDASEAEDSSDGALTPFLAALDGDAHLSFAYALPALEDDELDAGTTLAAAKVVTGALTVEDDSIGGSLTFHAENADDFVDAYNLLNRASTDGDDALEEPLEVAKPLSRDLDELGGIVVPLPALELGADADERFQARSVFRKLFVGMQGLDYAQAVGERTKPPWLDLGVLSEADELSPPSPGAAYVRWEFLDEDAIEDFEKNELPKDFRLAPMRFLEKDPADGRIFLTLNLYNAGGGSIVGGARAEWDVFVHGPDGADPNAGVRPRFMIVEALAEEVSADAANLLTPAEPLSWSLTDDTVTSSIARFDDDGSEIDVFEASFPIPVPGEAPVARFTREMAIGNDYIYWEHGVTDRALYNATTFNHDAHEVDMDEFVIDDQSHWAQYLKPEPFDAVYYQNSLQYVAQPMSNLDSDFLDIEPEWLESLESFTTNGHQDGLMRAGVERMFRGEADPLIGLMLSNETPATFYHFAITDIDALEQSLELPSDQALEPISLFVDDDPEHYLTLAVYEVDGSLEGVRAEWSVYVDAGNGRPPQRTVIDLMTERPGFDPATVINRADRVTHTFEPTEDESEDADDDDANDSDSDSDSDTDDDDAEDEASDTEVSAAEVIGVVTTELQSSAIDFQVTLDLSDADEAPLSLDWIESGDVVCAINGVCDLYYYNAETLDVEVKVVDTVEIDALSTPWDDYIDTEPAVVFVRTNAQEYAVKPWFNLDVAVEPLPFQPVDEPTHTIAGSGSLAGRDTDLVDSDYAFVGGAIIEDGLVTFAIDQGIENALGEAHIFTEGSFDLDTGVGTQQVTDCVGPALMCSDISIGSSAFYEAQKLDASDPDEITWAVDAVIDLGGSFGTADSSSTFSATAE